MKNYIILHNKHDARSRAFCDLFGKDHSVIDWYDNINARNLYLEVGFPHPGGFPFVVDPDSKTGVKALSSMVDTIAFLDANLGE